MAAQQIHPVDTRLAGEARVPYSKPHMQRAILLSLLTRGPSIVVHPAWSSETRRLYEAVQRFGLTVSRSDANRLVVSGVGRSLAARSAPLQVEGSAFNLRTLAALACLSEDETVIEANASMLKRPVVEHLGFVRGLGATLEDRSDSETLRIHIRGARHVAGEIAVDTRHSSQLLTAALLIAPLADGDVVIGCDEAALVAGGYVDLTISMMRQHGAVVRPTPGGLRVSPAPYESGLHHIASDFTALSYLVGAVAAAPAAEITVADYYPSELSSEVEFFEAARTLGVEADYDADARALRLRKGAASGRVEIDARNMPTVVPTLAAMSPFVDASVTVRNAAHVNNHKCRRVEVMIAELQRMGCEIAPTHTRDGAVDGFTTRGRQTPAGGVVLHSHGDHRIFMSLATAALGARRPISVDGAAHLPASFPDYLEIMAGLGVTLVPEPYSSQALEAAERS